MSRPLSALAWIALATGAAAQTEAPPPTCALAAADQAWLERALAAWRFTTREITGIAAVPRSRAFFFGAECLRTSDDALTSPSAEGVTWSAVAHGGAITLPDGRELPVGVVSFASGKDGLAFFVMSTPSVWSANGVGRGEDLERTMIAVLLHEASHVVQTGPYGARLAKLIETHALPDSFDDNAVQTRFRGEPEFAAALQQENDLFLRAAAATDDVEAHLLAYEARERMRERAARWFVGPDAYLAEAEDLWLTFEGTGQWAGYQWLVHPEGGAQPVADTRRRFARDSQWSQAQGFAVVMAIERLVGPAWKRHAFGDGQRTVLEMLDAALEEH